MWIGYIRKVDDFDQYANAGFAGPLRYVAYTYTDNGKQETIRDAGNNQTDLIYDKFDRLRYTFFPSPSTGNRCTAPTSETVTPAPSCPTGATYEELRYSTNGNPATSATALCSGNQQVCTKRTRKNELIAWTYDTLNRPSTKSAPGLPVVTTAYNLLGEILSVTQPASGSIGAASTTYDYDDAGRKLYEENLLAGTPRRVSYQYDPAGNRSRTTWPDGYFVHYQYDALNRMQTVRENSTSANEIAFYEYDSLSRRTALRLGGQTTHRITYSYEPDNNLDVLSHYLNSVTPSVTFDYGYNHSGQITSIAATDDFYLPSPAATSTQTYVPDKLNRYGSLTVGGVATTPTYDLNGNLLTWGPTATRQTYSYDAENRLRSANVTGGANTTYAYDALGRRTSKSVSSTLTYYLLDGDEEIAEYNSNGTVLRRYITGPAVDDRIARAEGSATSNPTKHYYHTNHQRSVIAMANAAGTITQQLAYDEYGNLTSQPPATTTGEPFRYTGRRYDPETGLYYYRARYYLPQWGRFLQTDPIGYRDDFNLYAYVGNDPLNKRDPTGMYACDNMCSSSQESAIETLSAGIGALKSLQTKLVQGGKLSAEDQKVADRVSEFIGKGTGTDIKVLAALIDKGTKMLSVLNSNMPVERGYGKTDLARAEPGKLVLYPGHFASSDKQQAQTLAHEAVHHGADGRCNPVRIGSETVEPYGMANIRTMAAAPLRSGPEGMLMRPDAVTFALGFERDDWPR